MDAPNQQQTLTGSITLLMRRAPVLRLVLALATGILIADHLPPQPLLLPAATAAVAVLLTAAALLPRPRWAAHLFLPLLWLDLIALGWLLGTLRAADPAQGLPNGNWGVPPGKPVTVAATLTDSPRSTPRMLKAIARVEAVRNGPQWLPANASIILYIGRDSASTRLRYGDRLLLHIRPQLPNGERNPHQFNYRRHLLHKGIGWQAFAQPGQWQPLPPDTTRRQSVTAWSKQLQQRLVARIQACRLTPSQQGIAEALLTGWREDLDDTTVAQFRTAGILHLLCVSGLHVGIVAWLAGACLFFLGRRQWHRVAKGTVQIVAIWLFVLITGMAPSTLRAGVMFTLLRLGDMGQRQPCTFNNLCSSALLLLLIDPYMLFDVGFQFSYTAVAGILALQDPLELLLPLPFERFGHRCAHYVWKLVCVTTAAQLGSLPFVLYHFHQFSTWFFIANLLIVPFAGVLLATSLCMAALAPVPVAGQAAAWLLRQQLAATDAITRWVGSLPGASLEGLYCNLPMTVLLAAALLLLVLFVRSRCRWALPSAAACLLAAASLLTVANAKAVHSHGIAVYDAGRHLAIECFDGRESYLVCDTAVARNPALIGYQRDGLVLHRRVKHTTLLPADTTFRNTRIALGGHTLLFAGRRLFILDGNAPAPPAAGTDAIIVAPGFRTDTALLRSRCQCDTLLYRYRFASWPTLARR